MEIVKVQVPIKTSENTEMALIYNKSRDIQFRTPVTEELLKKMNGDFKQFFFINKDEKIMDKAPWQKW